MNLLETLLLISMIMAVPALVQDVQDGIRMIDTYPTAKYETIGTWFGHAFPYWPMIMAVAVLIEIGTKDAVYPYNIPQRVVSAFLICVGTPLALYAFQPGTFMLGVVGLESVCGRIDRISTSSSDRVSA